MQTNNKIETITGRLEMREGTWFVVGGYGAFQLAAEIQAKPDISSENAEVEARVQYNRVIDYHFSEFHDAPVV